MAYHLTPFHPLSRHLALESPRPRPLCGCQGCYLYGYYLLMPPRAHPRVELDLIVRLFYPPNNPNFSLLQSPPLLQICSSHTISLICNLRPNRCNPHIRRHVFRAWGNSESACDA